MAGYVRDLWVNAETKMPTARHGTGRRWQANWVVDGVKRSRTFNRKIDAERYLADTVSRIGRGDYVDPQSGRITVKAYAEEWLARQLQLRDSSRAVYRTHLSRRINPAIGHMPIGDVRRSTVQGFVSGMVGHGLAPQTVRAVAQTCSTLFRAAVADQLIARSPMVGVKLPAPAKSRAVALTVDQLYGLAEHLPPQFRVLPLLGAGCGLRPGELLGLEVDPSRGLDMLGRRILVREQLLPRGGVLGPPKTAASVRDVPLADETLQVLAEHMAAFPPVDVPVTDRTGSRPVKRTARLLFSVDGKPVGRDGFNAAWNQAVGQARSAGVDLPARVTPHALRHAYVSILIAAGLHPKQIQTLVGHKSITETMDVYGHLMGDVAPENTRRAISTSLTRSAQQSADHG